MSLVRNLSFGIIMMFRQIIFFAMFIGMLNTACMAGPVNCGSKPISLAFFDYGLFHFNENTQSKGISPDVVKELRKRTNCEITSFVLPRARTWSDLSTGHLDMTVDGIVNEKRKSFGWFIPYNKIKNYALVKSKLGIKVRSANDFRDHPKLVFGVVRSFNHGEEHERWLKQMRLENRVEESVNIGILFNKFMLGRVDAIFAPPVVYRKFLKELNMENDVMIQDWAPSDKGILAALVLAKSRFSQADAKDWERLIMEMRDDGTFKQIFSRFLSQSDASWMAEVR
ncbi:MAG: polar amino acid transport system substrate-binding protein [Sulfurimonas sp.]|uniref:substrate-binding periplasmic protein n=1 Tax=Sulfurimonas sp. TaxID=2022749 RepID=UPI0039E4577C